MVRVSIVPKSLAEFTSTLTRLAAETGVAASDVAKKQAALICEDMATFTPPLVKGGGKGLSKKAETAGEEAIAGDVRKMFIAVGDRNVRSQKAIVFRTLAQAARTNNRSMFDSVVRRSSLASLSISPIMSKILNDPNHDRAFLKARNFLNRVRTDSNDYGFNTVTDLRPTHDQVKGKFGGRIKRGQRIGQPRKLVENKQTLDDYVKTRLAAVGRTKSGWLRALLLLPMPSGKNGPINYGADLRKATYIARHAGAGGYARTLDVGKDYTLTIGNLVGNINMIASEANTLSLALGNREKQMSTDLRKYLDRIAKQNNG